MIKSPYNFVPAPKENEVFTPGWAAHVLHDMPLSEDAESGEIEFTIQAETPIFIRNGHSKKDQKVFEKWRDDHNYDESKLSPSEKEKLDRYLSFSNYNGQYFIPATSIKGMLRNVLEIISNSKITQFDDDRHAVRQIMRTQGTVVEEGYELNSMTERKTIKCGYLKKENNAYFIYSCGTPYKIRFTDIDERYKKDFYKQFGELNEAKLNENFDNKTGKYKYELLKGCDLESKFEEHPLDEDDKQKSWVSVFQHLPYARFSSDGSEEESFDGCLVLTGQSSTYDQKTARRGEYVFRGKKSAILKNESLRLKISKDQIETFKFINRDNMGESQELKDWGYWKDKIEEGIPVFYREVKVNNEKSVKDFGLTFMYKQPTKYSVKDLIPDYGKKTDLASILFGQAEKDNSFKGRVFLGHAFMMSIQKPSFGTSEVTLGSPKSSFFPNYLDQSGNQSGKLISYNTYNTNGSVIRGFKRYPVKSQIIQHQGDSLKLRSLFKPLPEGYQFKGKVRMHNLKPLEIGALLASITLMNTQNTFHNLGFAKPLGYGRVAISDVNLKDLKLDVNQYLHKFELEMLARFGDQWEVKIVELLSMAKLNPNIENDLVYNDLTEFQSIKNQGYYLKPFSKLTEPFEYKPKVKNELVQLRSDEINKIALEKKANIENLKNSLLDAQKNEDLFKEKELFIQLNLLEPIVDFIDHIDRIEYQIKERDEQVKFEALIQRRDLAELRDFKNQNPVHENLNKVNKLIKELSPPEYPTRFSSINIDTLLKEIAQPKNHTIIKLFSENLINDISRGIIAALQIKRERKKWQDFKNKNTWGKVVNMFGEDIAKGIFNKIVQV